jgi:hypothetical protein
MTNKTLAVVLATMLFGTGTLALASPGGAGGQAGGNSMKHISDEGLLNTNGPDALDRDKGHQHASDRHALTHKKMPIHHKRKPRLLPAG